MDPLFIVTCWGRDWGPISITDAIKGRKSAHVRVVVYGNLLFIYVFTLYFSFPHLLAEATTFLLIVRVFYPEGPSVTSVLCMINVLY